MAFTFKKVLDDTKIGKSLYDEEGAKIVKDIMKKAGQKGVKIHLPKDFVIADKFEETAATEITDDKKGIKDGWLGLDIGPKTIEENSKVLLNSKTIFWNGPQGVFEMKPFAHGSLKMLEDVIKVAGKGATTVVGGGDTVNLVKK